MDVLKLHAANQSGDLEQMPKAGRPVRNRQTGIVAGDQPSRNDQQESQRGNERSKPMMSGVIGGRGQNCSLRVPIILASVMIRRTNTKPLKHRGTEEAEDVIAKIAGIAKLKSARDH